MHNNDNQEKNGSKISFKDTLNLPKTDFPIRYNSKIDDLSILDIWRKQNLYEKIFIKNIGSKKFILHDGPPYANGNIHLGHAYNKILKDIVTKVHRMLGEHVPVTPGWDCHGLPIELKVTQEKPGLSSEDIKKACREYANKWINIQREEFKKLGVLMDWDNPYLTMNYEYEALILKALSIFVEQGYIERKNKTVPWCFSCQTVLASAEIEYFERKDPSIYVLFPFDQKYSNQIFQELKKPELKNKIINLLIWTTTPWTLPLNRAVLIKPNTKYLLLESNNIIFCIAKELVDSFCVLSGIQKNVVGEFSSDKLSGYYVQHPFIDNFSVPIILDSSVSLEDGTAIVHCAPGCGPEDYEIGIKNNLEIYSPVNTTGKYTSGIMPKELEGMSVTDGQIWVIKKLNELNRLFFKSTLKHSYPHCWRCRNGLIFRATTQWFCDLSKHDLKNKVLNSIDFIKTVPEKSSNRLRAAIEGRLEWCISRQRVWGVPIPALTCVNCEYTFTNKNLIELVSNKVSKEGVEYWDNVAVKELLPEKFSCLQCKSIIFKKETDILDVWFDSGVSHFAVLKNNKSLSFPADIYLEGKDQHRGWFQSSLLTSLVLNNQACMKTILTHGFTVDEMGKKMSKSLGNVISPQDVIDKIGTDGLRLWASSINVEGEAIVSEVLLANVQEVLRKIRNTCRFLISNLYDFDINNNKLKFSDLLPIDQYALDQLRNINNDILNNYKNYEFTHVFHKLGDYCASDLSSFYLDIIKDRLYVEKADGLLRRSAQTTCWYILDTLTKLIAPILSFSAEQVSDFYQKDKKESIHLQEFNNLDLILKNFIPDCNQEVWDIIKNIRSILLKAIEIQREQGIIKHSLEANIKVYFEPNLFEKFNKFIPDKIMFFKELLIVSNFEIANNISDLEKTTYPGLYAKITHAIGDKCPRCWQWEISAHKDKLCKRCSLIVT